MSTPMKVILTNEVTGLGEPGDVVEVKAGYGRNFLIPRGLAMRWTRGAEKQIELIRRARAARDIRGLDDAKAAVGTLQALTVRIRSGQVPRAGCSARSAPRTSPTRSVRPAVPNWTGGGSRSPTRSVPSGATRSRSGCTPK